MSSVIKSRLQAGHANALRYKSSLNGMLTILEEEGISGLYKGVENKLIQSVLTAAILFACQRRLYNVIKKVSLSDSRSNMLIFIASSQLKLLCSSAFLYNYMVYVMLQKKADAR